MFIFHVGTESYQFPTLFARGILFGVCLLLKLFFSRHLLYD